MTKIKVSYTWIGPSAFLKGHDTDGPGKMLLRLNTQTHDLRFFCLKDQLSYYQNHFLQKPIQVLAIEDYLQAQSEVTDLTRNERAASLSYLVSSLLSAERNSIRDRVTIKVLFHYYLAVYDGGYIFDSNVKPLLEGQLDLSERSDLFLARVCEAPVIQTDSDVDVFAIYSPVAHPAAVSMLNKFLKRVQYAELLYTDKTNSAYYTAIIKALGQSFYYAWREYGYSTWQTIRMQTQKGYVLPDLGLFKEQENTHKHYLRKTYERNAELTNAIVSYGLFRMYPLSSRIEEQYPSSNKKVLEYLSEKDKESLYIALTSTPLNHDAYHDAFFQIQSLNNDKLKEYLDAGLDVGMRVYSSKKFSGINIENNTLLHFAVSNKNLGACTLILDAPGGLELCFVRATYGDIGTKLGITPIELAEQIGYSEGVNLMSEKLESAHIAEESCRQAFETKRRF